MLTRAAGARDLSLQAWRSRGHAAIFVRCLHLLDLDLLEDWPNITEQLFATKLAQKNLQSRVQAVEWALYRLFEIYDPAETKDKLRPFYPPTTQLQSVNLRAALYRCLANLKKNDVLGKDVLLRKTMLDDCWGERFEEVAASFAMTTLRRVTDNSTNLMPNSPSTLNVVPVFLAYRTSLRSKLRLRHQLKTKAVQQLEKLAKVEEQLKARREHCEANPVDTNPIKQQEIRALVNSSWIGDTAWADIMLRGASGKGILDKVDVAGTANHVRESSTLIEDLDERVQRHQNRLSEWKTIARDLFLKGDQIKASTTTQVARSEAVSISMKYSKHKALDMIAQEREPLAELWIDKSYDQILSDLRKSLDQSAFLIEGERTGERNVVSFPSQMSSDRSRTAVLGWQNRLEDASAVLTSTPTAAADENDYISDNSTRPSISSSPIHSNGEDSLWSTKQSRSVVIANQANATFVEDSKAKSLVPLEPSVSPSTIWMNLADRTRASMSFTNRVSILPDPDSPIDQGKGPTAQPTQPKSRSLTDDDFPTTLLERTRKSMSMFSNSNATRPRKAKNGKRTSQMFPVNQFETPGRSHHYAEPAADSRASTPREQLFDETAEYDSVFKSRPKLALSPASSPRRRISDLESTSEQNIARLDLDSDEDVD